MTRPPFILSEISRGEAAGGGRGAAPPIPARPK
jgi:hypothetical protein